VVTSIVTMLGESANQEAGTTEATIAAIASMRGDA
jgi:hypothetical protein